MSSAFPIRVPVRLIGAATLLSIAAARSSHAQSASAPAKPQHPAVCAKGVRIYTDPAQVPTPHDTLTMPAPPGPVRVTNAEEAEAAELAMRGRAGSVGATGVLITDKEVEEDGRVRMTRNVTAIFVASDAEHAQLACK